MVEKAKRFGCLPMVTEGRSGVRYLKFILG